MINSVKNIWSDLREKRLWPVAVVMLIGIVAIPTVLAKSSTTPAPSSGVAVIEGDAQTSILALDSESAEASGTGSSLDAFAPDDPFTPPRITVQDAETVGATAAGANEIVGGDVGGGGGSGGVEIDETVDVELPAPRTETKTETTSYEYVADISFWQKGRRRDIKGLSKLDMLPNQSAPLLIFMGAQGNGGNATFLVDSTLTTAGEGSCRPSPANCAFVDVGPGAEHVFTTEEGESFRLRVEEIRRVKVKAGAATSGPAARSSAGNQPATRRFTLPSLVDLVEVNTTETTTVQGAPARGEATGAEKANSSNGQGGR
jgi:hypothetical protein